MLVKILVAIGFSGMAVQNFRAVTKFGPDGLTFEEWAKIDEIPEDYRQEIEELQQGCPAANILNKEERKPRRHGLQVVHVISQVYNASHPVKRYENERALTQNLINPVVAAVHVLPEYEEDYQYARRVASTVNRTHKVVRGVRLGRRLNYSDAFEYANTHLAGKYVSIQHVDIFLDQSVDDAYFFDLFLDQPNTTLAMSRHDDPDCERQPGNHYGWTNKKVRHYCYGYQGPFSHDAFIFKAPLPQIRLAYLNFLPNHLGAENVVIFELLVAANLTVYNLCRKYRVMHVDCNRGLIQRGKEFSSAGERINVLPFAPARYQRWGSAYPNQCRNTVHFHGLKKIGGFEAEAGRAYWQEHHDESRRGVQPSAHAPRIE